MNYLLETARLRLRELTPDDTGFVIELLNSPGWLQFIGDRNVKTNAQAREYLEMGPLKSYREQGHGLALVERKEDGQAIGMCGLLQRANLDHPDLGFALLPAYSGQGYAFEIASATVAHAISALSLPTLYAIVNPDNVRSISLLEKLGFLFTRPHHLPGVEKELSLYTLPIVSDRPISN